MAEQHAIIVGIAWYLGLQWPGRLVIHPDNTLAAEVATSESAVASNRDTAYLLAGLHQLATARAGGAAPEYSHVKGHSGHPWNELADWAASSKADYMPDATVPNMVIGTDNLKALAWVAQSMGDSFSLPPSSGDKMVVDAGDCPVLPPQLALSAKSVPEGPKHRNIALTVAQANVLSLLPAQADEQGQAYDTTRTEQMCGIMRSEGLLFMGIQEARMKKKGVRRHRGHLRCLVWLRQCRRTWG